MAPRRFTAVPIERWLAMCTKAYLPKPERCYLDHNTPSFFGSTAMLTKKVWHVNFGRLKAGNGLSRNEVCRQVRRDCRLTQNLVIQDCRR